MTLLPITRTIQSLVLVFALACSISVLGAADVDPTFNPSLTRTLTGIYTPDAVQQPDGKWILFGAYNGGRYVQRVNADGSVDPTFDCPSCLLNTPLTAAVQADGKILFSLSGRLIRVHSNGSLDTSFKINYTSPKLIFPLADGKTVIVTIVYDGQTREEVQRLNSNGTIDQSFTRISMAATPGKFVADMAILPDGKMLIGGGINWPGSGGWIARYNSDGTLDGTFSATPNSDVRGIAITPDGRYILTGWFSSINGMARPRYARLFQDGTVDMTLAVAAGGLDLPYGIEMLPDGKFYIYTVEDHSPNYSPTRIIRYNSDGSADNTFSPTFMSPSSNWKVDAQGRIVTSRTDSGQTRYYRLNLDGSIDSTFDPTITVRGKVVAAALQTDGKILIIGEFEKANGVATAPFIRLNADGSNDSTFNAGTGFNTTPDEIVIQPDGKILVCGSFAGYNGTWRSNLARINSNGSVDTSFNATIDGRVRAVAVQPDGRVLIAGDFQTVNGVIQKGLARLNSDGALDTTFTPVFGSYITFYDILVQPDGSFLVGGYFGGVNGFNTNGMARFFANGTVDTGFTANAPRVNAIARRADGKYIVTTRNVGGNDSSEVFRLHANGVRDWVFQSRPAGGFNMGPGVLIQPSGNVLFSGSRFIERVGPDGERDIFFPTFGANDTVTTFINQPDGKVIVAGAFSGIEDVGRSGIARLTLSNRIRATPFDYDGDGRSDISVFRPSTNTWYEILSGTWSVGVQTFGTAGDVIVPADYDGDGKTDIGVFRPSASSWLYIESGTNTLVQRQWGVAGDIPMPSDVDGDGTSELIVYRPSNGQWFWVGSQQASIVFGIPGDLPVSGDFDGDGKSDRAIFRPSTGDWWYAASSANYSPRAGHWGQNGDLPVPADYDGDSVTDFAIFRPSDGGWYIYNSGDGSYTALQFGAAGDRPAPGDYDGDGKSDLAIFRPSTGVWYLWQSTSGFAGLQFGISGDVPTPGAFVP